jgi:hypothetical protein
MRESYAVSIDPYCSNVNRLCYVSHDPEMVFNGGAIPLEGKGVFGGSEPVGAGEGSSTLLTSTPYILHNSVFKEYENLRPIYHRQVSRFFGKPLRGHRNEAMVEIVAKCYCVVTDEFVAAFAEEYFVQHSDVYADYGFEKYHGEVKSVLEGCHRSYPSRLSEAEREVYSNLTNVRDRATFRIAQSLSRCESDETLPPPLFALSCVELGTRLGTMDTPAWRILREFEGRGVITTHQKGERRKRGQKGVATVYRWMI